MKYTTSKIYSAEAAAKELKISKMTMRRRIQDGSIRAQNIGSEQRPKYAIHECEIYMYKLFMLGELTPDDVHEGADLSSIFND